MNQIVMPIIQHGQQQSVQIPTEFSLDAKNVMIYRNERGDLVLRPVKQNRAEALLQAFSAFDNEFVEIIQEVLKESRAETLLDAQERDEL